MFVANDIINIVKHFFSQDIIASVREMSGGTVNKTYLIETEEKRVVIQKINRFVFENRILYIERNYKWFRQTYDRCTEKYFHVPIWKEDKSDNLIYRDMNGEYWRAYSYLPGIELDKAENKDKIIIFARTVAAMHRVLNGYKGKPKCAISHFHDFKHYLSSLSKIKYVDIERSIEIEKTIKDQARFVSDNCFFAENAVVHGDTKIKNIIYNEKNNEVSFIDLDTFYYSSRLIDIADSIRSISNIAGDVPESEDCVDFDKAVCVEFLKSYLSFDPNLLSAEEKNELPNAIIRMPFELGVRFYCDYLSGNQYFPVAYQNQNLMRAKCQFKLFQMMLEKNIYSIEREIKNL